MHPHPAPSRPGLRRRAFATGAAALAATAAAGLLAIAGLPLQAHADKGSVKLPPLTGGTVTADPGAAPQTSVFAGGCFWGVQAVFQHTRGVLGAVSGYAGGSAATARYEIVGSGRTGHAEAVQVRFDPNQVSYAQLLQIFFSVAHDPTQLNRQGPDRGTQSRSALFTTDAAQQEAAERYIAQLDAAKVFPARIVTQVTALTAFYPAEDYHQDYATRHPESRYIVAFDRPKITNLQREFPAQYRADPVLVTGAAVAKRR